MRIIHLAAEFAPLAKAGGLGEVIVGLSRELTRKSHDVEIILPKYGFIQPKKLQNLKIEAPNFKCLEYDNSAWTGKSEECQVHLLESHHPNKYFSRERIYGYDDDAARFIYFSRLALEFLALKNEPIDVLHLHDWHVSLAALMVKDLFKELNIKTVVLSIHNLEYQGKCNISEIDTIGLNSKRYQKILGDYQPDTINLLKSGILYSDAITPVSPTYASEILTPEYGFGLDQTLRSVKSKIHGILNGIDTTIWNPENDPCLDLPYSIESVEKAKNHYKQKFQPDQKARPWVGAISRLVPQKGPLLLEAALETTVQLGGTFLLLGSSPIREIQMQFDALKEKYKNHPQVYLHYEYDEELAHKLYACLDFLLVPSKFEPCGLTQLIGMRYGTVPIVRATGGLKDTVVDCEDHKSPVNERNGFLFREFNETSMNQTLKRAFHLFQKDPNTYKSLVRRGMMKDFSWKKPAETYHKLYRSLLPKRQSNRVPA